MTTTALQPGVTTDKIDAAIHHFIISHGAYPSPLLYQGFPKSCCTSVNNILTHGVPDEYVASASTSLLLTDHFLHRARSRPLQEGDILNVDITVYLDGYHGDTSRMFMVGEVVRLLLFIVPLEAHHSTRMRLRPGSLLQRMPLCKPQRRFADQGNPSEALPRLSTTQSLREVGIGVCHHSSLDTASGVSSTDLLGYCMTVRHVVEPRLTETDYRCAVNNEPGVMLPGHCFTIEVCFTFRFIGTD